LTGNCSSLTCVGQNDDANGLLQSEVIFETAPGEDYYVVVSGYEDSSGLFNFNIQSVACPSRTCQSAQLVDSFPFEETNTTADAALVGVQADIDCAILNEESMGVWYEISGDGRCYVITAEGLSDIVLSTLVGLDCIELKCSNEAIGRGLEARIETTPGLQYFAVVAGPSKPVSAFYNIAIEVCVLYTNRCSPVLTFLSDAQCCHTCFQPIVCLSSPINALCTNATEVKSIPFVISGSTEKEQIPDSNSDNGVFFTIEGNGQAFVVSVTSDYADNLIVYEGDCNNLLEVNRLTAYYGYLESTLELTVPTVAGTPYYIVVTSLADNAGGYTLTILVSIF
jgi:hypothetical protein